MKTFTDTVLDKVHNTVTSLGPLTLLIDFLVGRIAPQANASAACYTACRKDCSYTCPGGYRAAYVFLGSSSAACASGDFCGVTFECFC